MMCDICQVPVGSVCGHPECPHHRQPDTVESLRDRLTEVERERNNAIVDAAAQASNAAAEETRWQNRIIEVIQTYGLEPRDASGNESGDPLDYSADQVAFALVDAAEKERSAIVAAMRSWCDTAGEAYGEDAERIVAQLADSFENGEHGS